ncbi:MAG: glycine--tRNA ligase, partial [Bacteroidia bacterium]|nr:glycine--tRNA ligase [Bacteroidia bacterium]
WHLALGTPSENLRFHDHENLAHYANAAVDIEFKFPFGFRELEGIHSRTDFDLRSHEELSKKKLQYFDPELNENYIPYVVETSIGADRMFLSQLGQSLVEETVPDAKGNDSTRIVMKLNPSIAPVKAAVMPLLKNNEELVRASNDVYDKLKKKVICQYDEKDAIGRRYRRQDAIGTPYSITIDHQTLEDHTVTIRERDTLNQERVSIDKVISTVSENTDISNIL